MSGDHTGKGVAMILCGLLVMVGGAFIESAPKAVAGFGMIYFGFQILRSVGA